MSKKSAKKYTREKAYNIFAELWSDDVTFENAPEFYVDVITAIAQRLVDQKSKLYAYELFQKFIQAKNKQLQLNNQKRLPLPPELHKEAHAKPDFDRKWFLEGKCLQEFSMQVEMHWERQTDFSPEEKVGWLIYSLIMYGGINQKEVLLAVIQKLFDLNFKVQSFYRYNSLIQVKCKTNRGCYGSEYDESQNLFCTQQINIDNVSRLWMCHLIGTQPALSKPDDWSDLKDYFEAAINSINSSLNGSQKRVSYFLSYSSYVWKKRAGVDIDFALSNVLVGNIKTTGLNERDFNDFNQSEYGLKNNTPIELADLVRQKVLKQQHVKTKSQSDTLSHSTKAFSRRITVSLQGENAIADLENLALKTSNQMTHRLIGWLIELVKAMGLKQQSVLQYAQSIAKPIIEMSKYEDVEEFDADDFEDFYAAVLELKSDRSEAYRAKLLYRFHQYQIVEYGVEDVDIPYLVSKEKVSAKLLSTGLFQAILNAIDARLDSTHAVIFKLIYIIAYRTGMRKSEILGLTYFDIERLGGTELNLIVRANRHRSIKSSSSRRRVLLSALLKPDELNMFLDYLAITRPSQDRLGQSVFSLSGTDFPLDNHLPLNLLKEIIKDIVSEDHGFTFHSLRHTACTNLSLIICGNGELVKAFTDYSEVDIERIKLAQFGKRGEEQLGWYGLSSIMGHLTPETTFKNYHHLGFLMATYQLNQSSHELATKTMANISGISERSIRQNLKISNRGVLRESLNKLNPLLHRKTVAIEPKKPILSKAVAIDVTGFQVNSSIKEFDLFRGYNVSTILNCLSQLEHWMSIKDAAEQYKMDVDDVQYFFENAKSLAGLKTQRGESRLFSKRLKNDIRNYKLLPAALNNINDRRILFTALCNAQKVYLIDDALINSFVLELLNKINTRDAFISYSLNHETQLIEFLELGVMVLPEKYWLVHCPNVGLKDRFKKKFPNARFEVAQTPVARVGVSTRHQRKNSKKQFSTLLRHLVHVLALFVRSN